MWFRSLPLFLLAILGLALSAAANKPLAAVAFVDVKFDDKAAIWTLLLDPRYRKVVAITSGINAHDQAAYELYRYVHDQNNTPYRKVDMSKLEILQGTNALGRAAPHEEWWAGLPRWVVNAATEQTLVQGLHGYRLRIFQLAPTAPYQIEAVLQATQPGDVESFMLLHGYNSGQASKAQETAFLRSLRASVRAKNPQAEVFFTSSLDSYARGDGGKQPYAAIRHIFPQRDLDQAMRDPFWSRQLLRAHEAGVNIPPFPVQDKQQLDEIIYNARVHPEYPTSAQWRRYMTDYIQSALRANPNADHMTLTRLKYTHLPEFSGAPTLELADASHVAAFHRYLDEGSRSGMHVHPVAYPPGPHEAGKRVGFVSAAGNELHGVLLKGADRDQDLEYIKRLAGIPH
ncbi:hypothetical protein PSEUBRA_005379 [Kalmanozyma brasiliensis GHG001]|uniref:Uncharacterized protein n=1 Tax=Kalmanozyma brasiliensis (strain GHG001) TaxID=1365824 RepID=V5EJX2_KALBG|nr:uncharacterized protein PSEUBRA_005379 [Kalmanozyma brasiliensis GHG001]EST05120.1 hypothetical protein PSEUBRA_005379 [Kalmanozyma brasiliensis GHG001]